MRDENKMNQKQEKGLKLLNIGVIGGCMVVMFCLCLQKSLTYDEAYTIGMISRSYGDIIDITANDVHTPFYYFVLKFFCDLFGPWKMQAAKLFSLLFFGGHLIVGGCICRKIYNRKVEFYWLLLAGIMPAMVVQATCARMYTLGLFLFTLTIYQAYSIWQEEKISKWVGFTITAVLTMYVHTYSMLEIFVLYVLLAILILKKKRYKSLVPYSISGVIAAICYIPWLLVLMEQMGTRSAKSDIPKLTYYEVDSYFAEWFSNLENPQPLAILFGIALFIYISYYVRKYVSETKDYIPYAGLLIAAVVVTAAFILSANVVNSFLGRYIFPVFGAIWLFVAVGLEKVESYWKKGVIVFGIIVCGFFAYKEEWRLEQDAGVELYLSFMEENLGENDVIMADMFTDTMISVYIPQAQYMVYGYKEPYLPFANLDAFQRWEQLDGVDTVWYVERTPGKANVLEEYYNREPALEFSFSHYTFTLEKLTRKK